jgi:hypothetical protein
MAIGRDGHRASRLSVCREAATVYLLSRAEADDIIDRQVTIISGSGTPPPRPLA